MPDLVKDKASHKYIIRDKQLDFNNSTVKTMVTCKIKHLKNICKNVLQWLHVKQTVVTCKIKHLKKSKNVLQWLHVK